MSAARRRLVWLIGGLGAALIAAMVVIKIWFTASVFSPIDPDLMAAAGAPQMSMEEEPLDEQERIARDMVTPVVPGTPVMPVADTRLDPSDYSRYLARAIPIEVGMDRYLAKDELLLYYNRAPEEAGARRAKVSSSERSVDGATLFVIRSSGLADDSIAAHETYALFDSGSVVDFGSRQQCRRGDTPNIWTTELCP
ncbi:MAG: hypothetical protein AAF311_14120 [Pseudomonadota bacterium]